MSAETFWASSPKEVLWELDAARDRQQQANRDRVEDAWLIAVLSRQKRLPALKKLLEATEEQRPQTWQEMKARMREIANAPTRPDRRTQRSEPGAETPA